MSSSDKGKKEKKLKTSSPLNDTHHDNAHSNSHPPATTRVKVVVRVRPFVESEEPEMCAEVVRENNKSYVLLTNLRTPVAESFKFKFDGSYGSDSCQEEIFEREVEPNLPHVLNGLNTTIFAYGNTGAGKTHTMMGTENKPGIIPRTAQKLLSILDERQKRDPKGFAEAKYSITASYLEIYNEKVYDLLKLSDQDLPIREDFARNIFIPGLTQLPVNSFSHFTSIYAEGCKNRTTAATKLNENSSRSHAILILRIQHRELTPTPRTLVGKLHLIDLAGSEDNRKTNNSGIRLTESSNINSSLFVLGKVVNALNEGQSRVPYRDSKLTRLLQDSLGGNSCGIMIANVAPGQQYYPITLNTLNFAAKSRMIVNTPTVNAIPERTVTEVKKIKLKLSSKTDEDNKKTTRSSSSDKENQNPSTSTTTSKSKSTILKKTSSTSLHTQQGQQGQVIEDVVKKILQNELNQGTLLSQYLKGQNVLDATAQERLERLERKFLENEEEKVDQALKGEKAIVADDVYDCMQQNMNCSMMTPISKRKVAITLIAKAREMEKKQKDYQEALHLYQKADQLLPPNEKLQKTIVKLKKRVNEEDDTYSPTERKKSLEENISEDQEQDVMKKEDVVKLLNSGSFDQLVLLNGIGAKRANAIIAFRGQQKFQQIEELTKVAGFSEKLLQSFIKKNSIAISP